MKSPILFLFISFILGHEIFAYASGNQYFYRPEDENISRREHTPDIHENPFEFDTENPFSANIIVQDNLSTEQAERIRRGQDRYDSRDQSSPKTSTTRPLFLTHKSARSNGSGRGGMSHYTNTQAQHHQIQMDNYRNTDSIGLSYQQQQQHHQQQPQQQIAIPGRSNNNVQSSPRLGGGGSIASSPAGSNSGHANRPLLPRRESSTQRFGTHVVRTPPAIYGPVGYIPAKSASFSAWQPPACFSAPAVVDAQVARPPIEIHCPICFAPLPTVQQLQDHLTVHK